VVGTAGAARDALPALTEALMVCGYAMPTAPKPPLPAVAALTTGCANKGGIAVKAAPKGALGAKGVVGTAPKGGARGGAATKVAPKGTLAAKEKGNKYIHM